MGFMGGVSAIVGRRGAVGMCVGMRVTFRVDWMFRKRQEGGCDARQHPCD